MQEKAAAYFTALSDIGRSVAASGPDGAATPFDAAVEHAVGLAKAACADGGKIMFIGNGGSAAIASHMAIDYAKNGGLRAMAFNDGALLTCLSNDLGYDRVFAEPIGWHARAGDLLIAVSSSGRSQSILNGVAAARSADCKVLALSGFDPDNPLRGLGDVNFFVPSHQYGFVEILHLAVCHCILDLAMGWRGDAEAVAAE